MEPTKEQTFTLNELATALEGVQLGIAWWMKIGLPGRYRVKRVAALEAVNKKLSRILDKFSLPENDEGEKPDNGEDIVTLTWQRIRHE